MNKRTLPIAFVAVALAVVAIVGPPAEGAARNTPTPSPTATVTPLPTAAGPAAPSDLRIEPLAVFWNDNSNDEDGFLIDLTVCGFTLHYKVAANTTSFSFPPDYAAAKSRCNCGYQDWKVTAFNSRGEASAFLQTGIPSCAPPATVTPVASVMPQTGAAGGGDGPGWWQAALLASGVVALGGGLALFARFRTQGKLVK